METLSWLKIKSEKGHNPPPTRFLNVCTSLQVPSPCAFRDFLYSRSLTLWTDLNECFKQASLGFGALTTDSSSEKARLWRELMFTHHSGTTIFPSFCLLQYFPGETSTLPKLKEAWESIKKHKCACTVKESYKKFGRNPNQSMLGMS